MLRRSLAALALIGALMVTATPAQAAVNPIPPGDNLIVFAYYSSPAKITLVGQRWSGCGQPSGSWGSTSPYYNLYFTPC